MSEPRRLWPGGSLEAAHARIGARWGQRADEALWRRIETTRALPAVLHIARGSALAPWLGGIDGDATLHTIDRQLRMHWHERVTELADWMPEAWQPALCWCASGVYLPLLQRWARRQALPGWVAQDPRLAGLAGPPGWAEAAEPADAATVPAGVDSTEVAAPSAGRRVVVLPEPWASLAGPALAQPDQVVGQWLAQLLRHLPAAPGRAPIVDALLPLLHQHLQDFAAPATVDGWSLRQALAARLVMLWRRHPVEPVGAFIHVALIAIEGERLRGELIRRAAFPSWSLAA